MGIAHVFTGTPVIMEYSSGFLLLWALHLPFQNHLLLLILNTLVVLCCYGHYRCVSRTTCYYEMLYWVSVAIGITRVFLGPTVTMEHSSGCLLLWELQLPFQDHLLVSNTLVGVCC